VKIMRIATLLLAIVVMCAGPPALSATANKPSGFVDCSEFLELAGEDTGTVEVNLSGALLQAVSGIDPDLQEAVSGLESIHAVILTFEQKNRASRALDMIRRTEQTLIDRKWEVLTRIKDGTSNVTVLVLLDDDVIQGLVVLVADVEGHEVVCANIAGVIDLAKLASLGETLDIPGLDQIEHEDDGDED
jgi:hypothetical protein